MSATWNDEQVRRLVADLGSAGRRATSRSRTVIKKAGNGTVRDAQRIVPVDTGALKNSLHVDFDADGLGFEAGSQLGYAGYVEFGTSRMAPQPYLLPAFDTQVNAAMQAFAQVLDPWPAGRNT